MKDIPLIVKFSSVFCAYMLLETVAVSIVSGIPTDPLGIFFAFVFYGALPAAGFAMRFMTIPWAVFGEYE
ncbi:hypothetical protein [Xanthomonas vasicola]|uniref:hypothetical protein n=1 Tax=Xanthomonas vasicola TaxID=56459 RepID=UPI0003471217|nr:hypothetical protein [Xanthomonas vasicola]KFA39831.1 hypothetical protein KWS_0100630 [Xanthomonas vasicola pv. musacearum NCPPB 4384]AZR33110.1 hypothetical protein KWO_022160 [Xanthomonas vasicola pv. musacearum NCPPB 4379]KFA16080.1 hypothetical protein KWQ_0100240 [Xanthomonas vasicola pv. musacearum NCPPB 4380]KFA18124.1 hypothetical protein A11G_0112530 [Xanthomonas vasicola pv. musacearum NCPPB 4392]KFA26270.1 hypothetical protein KWU_0100255 [Xanthomonas vasicola pv. musacearum NCP